MKAKNLTIALAASLFALASCKPKAETTEEKVSAGADQVAEGVNKMVEAATPAAVETPVEPTEPTGAAAGDTVVAPAAEAPAVQPAVEAPAVQPAVEAPVAPAE
jgi:hypothetical protein